MSSLNDNHITTLERHDLDGLKLLAVLSVKYATLIYISSGAFTETPVLSTINLSSNTLHEVTDAHRDVKTWNVQEN